MSPTKSEKLLAYFYPLIILFGFVCSVTSAIAWNHWKYVLDTCVERNCGCILNGVSTITYFTGGHIAYCHYVTFALFISIILAIIFGCSHVWRVCMARDIRKTSQHSVRQRSGEMIIMTARSDDDEEPVSSTYWTAATFASGFMVLYSLVHVIVYIDGVWQTCRQYRNELIKYMHATGTLVSAVQGRIACNAVFDFMDYLFSDVSYDRRRIDRIDTSWCLNLAVISSVLTFITWSAVFYINIIQARRTKL